MMCNERRKRVFAFLDSLKIQYSIIANPTMVTQADYEPRRFKAGAVIFKNLFLVNHDKSRFYIYALPLTALVDLAAAAKALGETELRFGDETVLCQKLNTRHDVVSLFNVIGANNADIMVIIDSSAFFCCRIGLPPNDNTVTVTLKPYDIPKILHACGVEWRFLAPESEECVITKALETDVPEILRLQYAAYQSEAVIYNNFSIPPLTQTLKQATVEYRDSIVLKAVTHGRIIGSVRAGVKDGTVRVGKLIVMPGYQNRGIGKQLLRTIEHSFRGKRLELFTGSKSEKNLALYEKCGYKRFKTEETAPGLTLVYLEK